MSKLKPNTWLPLFGVETEYPPGVRYWISGLFAMHNADAGRGTFSLEGLRLIDQPHAEEFGAGRLSLLGVSVEDAPTPPDSIAVTIDAGAAYSLVGVNIFGVDISPKDTGHATFSIAGVRLLGTLVVADEAATASFGLLGVTII
jgi:hypothetical protein